MGRHLGAYTRTWPQVSYFCLIGDKKICFGMENLTFYNMFFFSLFFILCCLFQILDIYMPINLAGSVYFAQPDALKVHVICMY